jgi:hypothetical protein
MHFSVEVTVLATLPPSSYSLCTRILSPGSVTQPNSTLKPPMPPDPVPAPASQWGVGFRVQGLGFSTLASRPAGTACKSMRRFMEQVADCLHRLYALGGGEVANEGHSKNARRMLVPM